MTNRIFKLSFSRLYYTAPYSWKQVCRLLAVLLIFSTSNPALAVDTASGNKAGTDNSAAVEVVKMLHDKLLYIMQNAKSLGYQGRYDAIQPFVTTRFDTELIARVIMSRYWKQLDEQQQMNFISLFKRLSVATYASRFDGFSGESFVELSTENLKKGRLLIKTQLKRPHDEPVKLDYLMHKNDGQWMIISVIANGVNDLSLKRAEYATVIKDKGFQGLVDDVSAKISDMESEEES